MILSNHAKIRMKERGISHEIISRSLHNPDKIEVSKTNQKRFLIKKIYFNGLHHRDHLLLIVCEKELYSKIKVITLIDTSKISKHF